MDNLLWEDNNFNKSYERKKYSNRDVFKLLKVLNFNTTLDIGCARAGLLKALGIPQGRYTGFDISETMIKQNKKDYPAANWDIGNITNLPYNDNSFDVVVCSDVLIHVPQGQWHQALDECLRVANTYVLLVIRNKIGKTKYSTQTVNGYTAPYNIFGIDFWNYIKKNRYVDRIVHKRAFLNKGKCLKFHFPVWTTTVLIKIK